MTRDERARQLARDLLAAACADDRPGVPLAQRLEDAAPKVLGDAVLMPPDPGPPFVRGPGDEECVAYEEGDVANLVAACETDGHYLCAGCAWNVHRTPHDECGTVHRRDAECPAEVARDAEEDAARERRIAEIRDARASSAR